MLMPFSRLMDLICVHQIKEEGFTYKRPSRGDRDELLDLLKLR